MQKLIAVALLSLCLGIMNAPAVAQIAASNPPESKPNAVRITQGPTIENTTGTEATIAWSTNVPSSTVLKYGTDPNALNQTAETPWGGLTHRVVIKYLQPETTYYFTVGSAQAQGSGTSVLSSIQQFQTKSATVTRPSSSPRDVAAGPVVQDLTPNSAILWWHSDQTTPAQFKFGLLQGSLDRMAQDAITGQDHRVLLSGLESGKTYYFSITKPDGSPVAEGQFNTPQQELPDNLKITDGPVIEFVGHNHAIIAWSTSAPASSIVRYGTDPGALNRTAQASWGSTTHRVDVTNLHPNTKYYFEVISSQAEGSGTIPQSAPGQFHTMGQGQQALALSPR